MRELEGTRVGGASTPTCFIKGKQDCSVKTFLGSTPKETEVDWEIHPQAKLWGKNLSLQEIRFIEREATITPTRAGRNFLYFLGH